MLVVEFRIQSPILAEALAHAPETTVTHEEQYSTDGGISYLFWAEGEAPAAFEAGLAADPTVEDPVVLAETESGRLYRVTFTGDGMAAATFPSWSELDISHLSATASTDGWEFRLRMPDRDALRQYRELCEQKDLQFELLSVYEEREAATASEVRLTRAQREALVTARKLGYFDIPRQASLADVADRLNVSQQAVSERIRRGTAALVDATRLAETLDNHQDV